MLFTSMYICILIRYATTCIRTSVHVSMVRTRLTSLQPEEGLSTSVRVYFRMPDCPDETEHLIWTLGNYEYPEALCCSGVGTYDSCYDACDCIKVDPAR